MPNEIPLQYEGILALIQTNNLNQTKLIEANHKSLSGFMKSLGRELAEFKTNTRASLEKADEYNVTQNGRVKDMMTQIRVLEDEVRERKLTCGAAVEILTQDKLRTEADEHIEEKEARGRKLSKRQWVALFIISLIIGTSAITGTVLSLLNYFQAHQV